jgi:hypothetical protein
MLLFLSYSSVLRTDNTSCTCLQCYYVIFEKVFALTELLHILKTEAASTSKILVPTYWTTYCHLPKKSITKRQTLESHTMHKTSVSKIPFSLSTLASSFASVITIQSTGMSVLRCPNYHKPPHSTFYSSTIHIFNPCCTNDSTVME